MNMDQKIMNMDLKIANLDPKFLQQALTHNYEDVCKSINQAEIISRLYSKNVISLKDKQLLHQTREHNGGIHQCEVLMDKFILDSQPNVLDFIKVLKELHTEVYKELIQTAERIKNGVIHVCDRRVKDIKQHLIQEYTRNPCNIVESLPGEAFILDVSNDDHMMDIDFTANKLHFDKIQSVLPILSRQASYKEIAVETVADVIQLLQQEESSRLVLFHAHAGCGKTVLSRYLVTEFVRQENACLHGYDLLFFLPVRDIKTITAPIVEILVNFGYIKPAATVTMDMLLSNPKSASKILMEFDGIDELTIPETCQLYGLIKGDIFPDVKVCISSRPEANVLKSIQPLKVDYIVDIKGTTCEGVYSYLERNISSTSEDCNKKEEVKALVKRCKLQMIDFPLLKIPLYLTIIRYVFDNHWKEHLSFKQFVVPNTISKLFCALMNIFLRVWLKKTGKIQEAKNLKFQRSPLDGSSNLPHDMKRILHAIGRLSYNCLKEQIYSFSKEQLDHYFISLDEIKLSGLFCFSQQKDQTVVFFRHKQLQEFMAAIYLCHERTQDPNFQSCINGTVKNLHKSTLMETFEGIETIMYFSFGLSPEFALEILNTLKGRLCVSKREHTGYINIHYESRLHYESDNNEVSEAIRDVLVHILPKKNENEFESPLSTVFSLCNGLTENQTQTLLKNWYGLTVNKSGDSWCIQESEGDIHECFCKWGCYFEKEKLVVSYFNDTLLVVLYSFTFQNVKFLQVRESATSNVNHLTRVFPKLQHVELGIHKNTELGSIIDKNTCSLWPCMETPFSITGTSSSIMGTSLPNMGISSSIMGTSSSIMGTSSSIIGTSSSIMGTSVPNMVTSSSIMGISVPNMGTPLLTHTTFSGISFDNFSLANTSVASLTQQTELKSLTLLRVDLLSEIEILPRAFQWRHLEVLEIMMYNFQDEDCQKYYNGLPYLFGSTPQLKSLTWCCERNLTNQAQRKSMLSLLLESVKDKVPRLQTLRLGALLYKSSQINQDYIQTLCSALQNLTNVTVLGLGVTDIEKKQEEWAENLVNIKHIATLEIVYYKLGVPVKVVDDMRTHTKGQLQVQEWQWKTDLFQKCTQ